MQTLFGRKRACVINPNSLDQGAIDVLSTSFAKEVLELEEQLAMSLDESVLLRLIQLYSAAIEHYSFLSDPKYAYYKEKLHGVLHRKDLLKSLGSEPPSPEKVATQKQEKDGLMNSRIIEKALKTHYESSNELAEKVHQNLKGQTENLRARIQKRKSLKEVHKESDACGGITSAGGFEDQLEVIMERYYERKKTLKKKIKQEHADEAETLQEMGESPLLNTILKELKQRMDAKLQTEIEELNRQKKAEIKQLKVNFKAV